MEGQKRRLKRYGGKTDRRGSETLTLYQSHSMMNNSVHNGQKKKRYHRPKRPVGLFPRRSVQCSASLSLLSFSFCSNIIPSLAYLPLFSPSLSLSKHYFLYFVTLLPLTLFTFSFTFIFLIFSPLLANVSASVSVSVSV
ncbi:hypothetical protein BKA57DRAFT_192287 [Linnemannia elongata]|nr:hypothetical protein BKA57DRAFT_192287 [Linnemannia elongata]